MGELTRRLRALQAWVSPGLAILLLYFILFLPFWKPLAAAFICAAACQPARHAIRERFRAQERRWVEGGLWTAVFVVGLGIGAVITQAFASLSALFTDQDKMRLLQERFAGLKTTLIELFQSNEVFAQLFGGRALAQSFRSLTSQAGELALTTAKDFFMVTPDLLLSLFLFVATFMLFFFKGDRLWSDLGRALGFDGRGDSVRAFEDACAVSLGASLLTGAVQTVLVVIGAKAAGFEFLSVLAVLTFVLSFVPLFGAGGVAVALALLAFLMGDTTGAGILLVTAAIVGAIDNVLRAWLFSRAAQGNALMSLIALLGALVIFGAIGLLLAPVIEQLALRVVHRESRERSRRRVAARATTEACI